MRRLLINPLVTALLVTATIDDAHAARQVAIFPSTGDVCLDPDSVDAVVKALSVPAGSAITLIAYSDATDVRRGMKLNESCLSRKIPKGISGHLRVAAARALSVYEAANKAGTPGFDAPPVFQIALGEA